MAEIRIEKKKPVWPWLVGILGLLLLGWLAVDLIDKDNEPELLVEDEQNFPDLSTTPMEDEYYIGPNGEPESYESIARNPEPMERLDESTVDRKQYNQRIDALTRLVADMQGDMGLGHEFSHSVLTRLANLTVMTAREHGMASDINARQQADMIKQQADRIMKDWDSGEHADAIRKAAMSITDMMQSIQTRHYPDAAGKVEAARQAAMDIDPATLTLDQKDKVKTFYERAYESLMSMKLQ